MLKLDITFLLAATVQTTNKDATTHSLYDVMKDFVLPVVVALVAAWIAYYVFYRGSQLEKQKARCSAGKLLMISYLILPLC